MTDSARYEEMVTALRESIGRERLMELFRWPYCEHGYDFLGFLENYAPWQAVPLDFTIVDIGCYTAPQADYFKNHALYIGVDIGINVRLAQANAAYLDMTGQAFIRDVLPTMTAAGALCPERTFAICSAVPDRQLQDMVTEAFPYHFVAYPGMENRLRLPEGVKHNYKKLWQ